MRASDVKIGEIYGNALVLCVVGKHPNGYVNFRVQCQICGNVYVIHNGKLGKSKLCANCKTWYKIHQIQGKRFGALTVKKRLDGYERKNGSELRWLCECDCGQEVVTTSRRLLHGITTSCNLCSITKRAKKCSQTVTTKHIQDAGGTFEWNDKLRTHPNYFCWRSMIDRCTRPDNHNFHNYGGRGIKICDRWMGNGGFIRFIEDMGMRPSKDHSIDRIDVNGDYEPSNCRWATIIEQCNNRRENVFLICDNEQISISQFRRKYNIRRSLASLHAMVRKGYDIDYIIKIDKTYSQKDKTKHNDIYINYNRVVSDEVMQMLENSISNG